MRRPKHIRRTHEIYRCPWHRPDNLPYVAASLDADERIERGEKQRFCPDCCLYYWPHEFGEKPL